MPSAVCQSWKFGRIESAAGCCAATRTMSPCSPPTPGAWIAKYAAANAEVMVMQNWIMSVTITPHRPAVAAKTIGTSTEIASVSQRGQPNSTPAIFTSARLTVAMIQQLKNSPR